MVMRQWMVFVQDTRDYTTTLYEKCHGILMTTESRDLGLTSHPKDNDLFLFKKKTNTYCSFSTAIRIK